MDILKISKVVLQLGYILVTFTLLRSLLDTQRQLVKAESRAAYLQAKSEVYTYSAGDGADGTCYSKGGCK